MSDDKDEEADFFLAQLKIAYPKSEMKHSLSAFLSASRSMAYYLLEDYNMKFGLGIQLTDWLTNNTFRNAAKNNNLALQFINDYENELKKIENNPVCGFLVKKRNLNIHRTMRDTPLHAHVNLQERVDIGESISVVVRDKDGNVKHIDTSKTQPSPIKEPQESKSEVTWYFNENMNDEIPTVCECFLSLMRGFVSSIRQKYP